jgi:hypothetical protein
MTNQEIEKIEIDGKPAFTTCGNLIWPNTLNNKEVQLKAFNMLKNDLSFSDYQRVGQTNVFLRGGQI